MGRHKKLVTPQEDGNYVVEAVVPGLLWELATAMGVRWGKISPIAAFTIMLQKLELLFSEGESPLGGEYTAPLQRLQLTRTNLVDDPAVPPIEYGLLHASLKLKSGFAGVYANGQGFRAMGKTPGHPGSATHCIGTFPTAEEAAWRRRLYYKANDLPYGAYEDAVDALRKTHHGASWTEEALHKDVIHYFSKAGNTAALEDVPKQYEEWIGRDWMMEESAAAGKRRDATNKAEKEAKEKAYLEKKTAEDLVTNAKLRERAIELTQLNNKRAADALEAAEAAKLPDEFKDLADSKKLLRKLAKERKQQRAAGEVVVEVSPPTVPTVTVEPTEEMLLEAQCTRRRDCGEPGDGKHDIGCRVATTRAFHKRKAENAIKDKAKTEAAEAKAAALKAALTPTGEVVAGIALLPMPIDPSTWVDHHDDPIVDEPDPVEATTADPWSAMRSYNARPTT